LGRWGFWLFCASLAIGCAGAALELALDVSYIIAQTFGWAWSEDQTPHQEARFALVYTGAIAVAALPSLAAIDPLKLTMFSMAVTVIALPIVVAPLLVIMNDPRYLKSHTNGVAANIAVALIVVLGFALAVLAIPVQLTGG
jgi:Mn2+/Fe2+ NRAMP family transporter